MERWFTPQERGVILFFVATILLGIAIYLYKSKTPYFAPELKILSSDNTWQELDGYPGEDTIEHLIHRTEKALTTSESKVESSGSEVRKININTATEEEIITLPGIGPVLAKRIIEYRERSGGFKSIEDIISVRGIGQKKFELIKDKITI